VGIFKTAGREVQPGVEAGTIEPVGIKDTTLAGTSRLNPAQSLGSPAAIVGGEEKIPCPESDNRSSYIND
jgi:hypothetical protein